MQEEKIMQKVKYFIMCCLICVIVLFMGCEDAGEKTEEVNAVVESVEETVDQQNADISEMQAETTEEEPAFVFEQQEIYNNNGLVITAVDYYMYELLLGQELIQYPVLELKITNDSEAEYSITAGEIMIDNIEYSFENYEWAQFTKKSSMLPSGNNWARWNDIPWENVIAPNSEEIFCVTICTRQYYTDSYDNSLNFCFDFGLKDNDTFSGYSTGSVHINSIYPTDECDFIQVKEYQKDNMVFQNDDMSIYLVSATFEEDINSEEAGTGSMECIFLVESKISAEVGTYYKTIDFRDENEVYINDRSSLSHHESTDEEASATYNKEGIFMSVVNYNASWEEIEKSEGYSVYFIEEELGFDEGNWYPDTMVADGYINIAIDEFEYIQR